MAGEGQLQFTSRNARSVVSDANKLESAIHQVNANLRSSCINAILDKFLHNRCWPLDNFSCSNFCRDIGRKLAYWHKTSSPKEFYIYFYLLRTSVQGKL